MLRTDGSFTYTPTRASSASTALPSTRYDGQSGGNVATTTLDVGNTTPPGIVNPGDQTNTEGDTVSLAIQVNEPPGYVVGFGSSTLPPGLSIAPFTGLISGTVAFDVHPARPLRGTRSLPQIAGWSAQP